MAVPKKRYYIEKLQILMEKQSLYTSVIVSHIENSKHGTVNLVVEHVGVVTMCSTTTTLTELAYNFCYFQCVNL